MSLLVLQGIRKRYGAVAALDGVDLTVPAGSRTAIVGPSGSGKSTLLRIIAGFEPADSGSVTLAGAALADGAVAVPAHRRGIGVVAQDGALFPHLTIAENVGFGIARGEAGREARIADLMAMVGLETGMAGRRPDQLSGGQQQRVALARALARKPRLMLLDEPFSSLDAGLRVSTRKAVARLLSEAAITTILVTHDQEEALSFADQVAVMREGRLPQAGSPRDIYLRPRDRMIAEFLGDAIVLPAEIADGFAECALGRLGIGNVRRRGTAEIMLRPSQISLRFADGIGGETLCGKVVDVDFAGSTCTIVLRLIGMDGIGPMVLRRSGFEAPPVGAVVAISVAGDAHVFPMDTSA